MKIQQIRNATIRIECAGKHFLIDPWFQKKGTGMSAPSPDPEKAKIPSPTTELPFSVEQIMEGIDAMIDGIHMTGDDSGIRCSLTYIQNILSSHDETPKPHQLRTAGIEHYHVRAILFQSPFNPFIVHSIPSHIQDRLLNRLKNDAADRSGRLVR